MTYTRAIGITFGAVIDRIVRWLALSRIHPNVLTFLGLVINIVAAWMFAAGNFRGAGLVVIGAGLFDMVDGRVAAKPIALPSSAASSIPSSTAIPTLRCSWACWCFMPVSAASATSC